jgi:hypothetical protein
MATLTINFTAPNPIPSNGYRVKYWLTSNPGNVTTVTPNPTASPIVINNVPVGAYTGSIEVSCGGNTYSSPQTFTATATAPTITVVSAYGSFEPCIGGTIDDYIGGQITVSRPVPVDTNFGISVSYVDRNLVCGVSNYNTTIYGTILAGSTTGTVNACTNGTYVPSGGTICSATGFLQ